MSIEVPIDLSNAFELERDIDFGGSSESGEIVDAQFCARIGEAPIARRWEDIRQKLRVADSDLASFYQMFDLWVVPHRVSMVRRRGLAEPTSIGIEVQYLPDGHTCSIVGLFPDFAIREHGALNLAVDIRGKQVLQGELSGAAIPLPVAATELAEKDPELSLGSLGFSAKTSGRISFQWTANVATPYISAVGLGSTRAEWRFDRHQEPLFGRDIETWSVVAVPEGTLRLRHRVRFYFNSRTWLFNTRRESKWTDLECEHAMLD